MASSYLSFMPLLKSLYFVIYYYIMDQLIYNTYYLNYNYIMDEFIEIGNKIYKLEPSIRKNKKYDVYYVLFSKDNKDLKKKGWSKYTMDGLEKDQIYKKYVTSFGDKRYQHFKDQTPLKTYKNLDHNDPKRRDLYRQRHKNDNINDPNYAGYWSWFYLW